MVEQIKKLLGIGKYSKMYQLQRKTKLKELLQNIKNAMGGNWEDTWMCTTDEGTALARYLRPESIYLSVLNEKFGKERYGIHRCKLLPVHNVVSIVYNMDVNIKLTNHKGTPEGKALAVVRKELFDYWCMELIGEKV